MKRRFICLALCLILAFVTIFFTACPTSEPQEVLDIVGKWKANIDSDGKFVEGEPYVIREFTTEKFPSSNEYKCIVYRYNADGTLRDSSWYYNSWSFDTQTRQCYFGSKNEPLTLSSDKNTLFVPWGSELVEYIRVP